jgi:sulfatase-like protein
MLTAHGKNAPAPWVPYTHAGCNFGAVGAANTVLENIATDVPIVFGPNSTQSAEAKANRSQAIADFVGIAMHCAANSNVCSATHGGRHDILPDELGNYSGLMALFGHKYVAPQINPSNQPMTDLDGKVIKDTSQHIGFPGFGAMSAAVSLSYVAAMQEHGIPVTYAYIADAHDPHPSGSAFGPGQAGYAAALKANDDAFAKFFARLQSDGINSKNTLFVFTSDEGDHFVGGQPTPANCDGITIPCLYSKIGEISTDVAGLFANQTGIVTPFKVHADTAPTIYITDNPARNSTITRDFERAVGNLTAHNPIMNQTDTLTEFLADPVEMKLLHMITADPARTSTFTMFADPNYFLFANSSNCGSHCVTEDPSFAWNHGDIQPEITTTWLGLVGPGVAKSEIDNTTWSDHADIRPTMMLLLGLRDDYTHDGVALVGNLTDYAVPEAIKQQKEMFFNLTANYKQLNAPLGQLALDRLKISTRALESGNSVNDENYANLENKVSNMTNQRDALAAEIIQILQDAEFSGKPIDPQQAQNLMGQAKDLACPYM